MKETQQIDASTLRSEATALLNDLRGMISESIPGRLLPSEWVLARKYSLSRNTVSKIFKILVQEGLVEREVGRGTLVKGQQTITFLMPCPEFLTSSIPNARIVRQRMHGAMEAAQERNLGFETIAVSHSNNLNKIDFNALSRLNAGSMVILDSWYRNIFPMLAKRCCRVALIDKKNIPYGFAQYTKSWFFLTLNCKGEVYGAMDNLMNRGCRKIALIGQWINETGHPVMHAFRKYTAEHGMKMLYYVLPGNETAELNNDTLFPPAEKIRAFYEQEQFDGIVLGSGYFVNPRPIQEQLGVPESVKICGIDQNILQMPIYHRYPYYSAPNRQMGYDAVAMLADNSGSQPKSRLYDYDFYPEP